MRFLFSDIFSYCTFIQTYCTYIVPFGPKLSVAELVFQVRVLIKNHQGTLALQVPHKTRHAYFRRDTCQHMHMIWHEVTLQYFNPLVMYTSFVIFHLCFREGSRRLFSACTWARTRYDTCTAILCELNFVPWFP